MKDDGNQDLGDMGRRESDFMDLMAEPRRSRSDRSSSEQALQTIYLALVPLVLGAMVLIPMASMKTSQVWQEVSLLGEELEKAGVILGQERFFQEVHNTTSTNELREKIKEGRKLGLFDDARRDLFSGKSDSQIRRDIAALRRALSTGDYTHVPADFAKRARELLGRSGVDALKRRLKNMSREDAEALVMNELSKQGLPVSGAHPMANGG